MRSISVIDLLEGKPVWSGTVELFALHGHAKADRCYAWSEPVAGSDRRRFFAVLHAGEITDATDAVRASILQDHRDATGTSG
jgi:hypothetical protein